jgi:hypothetical protein
MAMMCRTRLIRRFPARDSRWRSWLPEEASSGAVPFGGRELVPVSEPVDVAGAGEQPGGA